MMNTDRTSLNSVKATADRPKRNPRPAWMRNKAWVPDQHGAWGMLLIPLIVGVYLSGLSPAHPLLLLTALLGFLAFHAVSLWWKTRLKPRFRTPSLTYLGLFTLSALALVFWQPQILWWFVATPLGLLAIWRAYQRDERSLLARVSIILVASLLTPIAYDLGTGFARPAVSDPVSWWPSGALHQPSGWPWVWYCTLLLALYFIGTVPFVKTMIRQRRSNTWLLGSLTYHALVAAVVAVLASQQLVSWLAAGMWVLLLARAAGFPLWMRRTGKPVKPAIIGATETVTSLLVLFSVLA
ncbi:YwiC-like family protein [Boudabousia marimammalium]|uniref:YwiC-like protein n=1 Tax=Boudabousia marimammalium TaxID=156892 RepID=A0A1Q5PTC3_9ACTO|nr:YwiC-like family protein [Boudabousia marimammalium]OKL50630.1 hypothetical protein BM477_01370 [Boudabousia marimammalium]